MARVDCKLCNRDDKEAIEEIALADGPRAAARVVGCSHNAVMRHMANHMANNTKHDVSETPTFEKVDPATLAQTPPKPKPRAKQKPIPVYPTPSSAVAPYKQQFPHIAALQTAQERRHYLADLFRRGRFHGLRTSGLLSLIWDDLGPIEFAELVTQAAIETNFRRGSEQARRVVLVGKVEQLFTKAVKANDLKTAARLLETWAKLDVPIGVDMMTALLNSEAWRVIAPGLMKKFPEAFEFVHGELVAEESRKRQALAPMTAESNQDG